MRVLEYAVELISVSAQLPSMRSMLFYTNGLGYYPGL